MKIYVFTSHATSDCEFLGVENRVFRTKEAALSVFNEWRDKEKKFAESCGWEIGTDEEDYFEAYEDGRYCTNHTVCFVNEYEV